MPKLKSRNEFIPGGFRFILAGTGYDLTKAMPHRSFNDCVNALLTHVRANAHVAAQSGIPPDFDALANMVEDYSAREMARLGYKTFIVEDAMSNPQMRPLQPLPAPKKANAVAAGAKTVAGISTYIDWVGAGGKPVLKELSESRGSVCVSGDDGKRCPMNQPGDWKTFFTEKAAQGIKAVFGMMNDLDLSTSNDKNLGVCKNCSCPLGSKVWTPLKHIRENTSPETMEGFPSFCWIKKESVAS